jgi:SAM-dependent methyltransferase
MTPATAAIREQARGLDALNRMRDARRAFQDANAATRDKWIRSNKYFYGQLKRLLRFIVGPGKRVLEVRCMTGDLLAATRPHYGVGVEIGSTMTRQANDKHPELHFVQSDPESLELGEKFDCIIFNHIFDTVDILQHLSACENTVKTTACLSSSITTRSGSHCWDWRAESGCAPDLWSRTGLVPMISGAS